MALPPGLAASTFRRIPIGQLKYLAFSGASLTKSTGQNITTLATDAITFDGEYFDTDNYHDNSTNPARMTVPTTGFYLFSGAVVLNSVADQKRVIIYFRKNGTTILGGASALRTSGTSSDGPSHTALLQLSATDYVELMCFNGDASTRSVSATGDGSGIAYSVMRVG